MPFWHLQALLALQSTPPSCILFMFWCVLCCDDGKINWIELNWIELKLNWIHSSYWYPMLSHRVTIIGTKTLQRGWFKNKLVCLLSFQENENLSCLALVFQKIQIAFLGPGSLPKPRPNWWRHNINGQKNVLSCESSSVHRCKLFDSHTIIIWRFCSNSR